MCRKFAYYLVVHSSAIQMQNKSEKKQRHQIEKPKRPR